MMTWPVALNGLAQGVMMTDALVRTSEIQQHVGTPTTSAWVSANAGTGKTYVLVRRVIRQLLAGASPSSIVCITYTKAAAAEMSGRLLGMLSSWALMPDDQLADAVADVTGKRPEPGSLTEARRLFARAVESPGGLKIQTIHSFCASLLARFPAEAGLQLGFRPLEDDEAAAVLREAIRVVTEQLSGNDHYVSHLRTISARFQEGDEMQASFQPSIERVIQQYTDQLRGGSALAVGADKIIDCLRTAAGGRPGDDPEELLKGFCGDLDLQFLRDSIATLPGLGKKRLSKFAQDVEAFLEAPTTENAFLKPFCTNNDGEPYKLSWLGMEREKVRDFDRKYKELCELVAAYRQRYLALAIVRENEALLWVAELCIHAYRARKESIGALDYDDLIQRTLNLLRDVDNAWIRYKLDEGIDHILLDEAQDNSDAQWKLFNELAEEIIATDTSAAGLDRARSIFVVGDPKQSIYAFQGAEADLFQQTRQRYEEQIGPRLASRSLFLSFRTAQPVLDVVDQVFRNEEFIEVSGMFPQHESRHKDRYGSVELWPTLEAPDKTAKDVWTATAGGFADDSYDLRVAAAIASDISRLLASGSPLACREGRPICPSDVMVLFQRRGTRFAEVLRALSEEEIPCAGTDRVRIAEDQAVHDLISLLRFAANTDDSLSLAVLLKSPFFGWSEDELFALCTDREQGVLWRELRRRAALDDHLGGMAQAAVRELQSALDKGARHGPYALLTAMLEGGEEATGRRRLAARLGQAYRDAVDAFLDEVLAFEDAEPRSIHAFLQRAERLTKAIKRDSHGQREAGVRLMTVHGAKGLEAPIVYLADADFLKARGDQNKAQPVVTAMVEGLEAPLPFLLPSSAKLDTTWVTDLRRKEESRMYQEYQRLLYVAATRAEERLVVCGGKEDKNGTTWHSLVASGLKQLADSPLHTEESRDGTTIVRFASTQDGSAMPEEPLKPETAAPPPGWLHQYAAEEEASPIIYPSALGDDPLDRSNVERVDGAEGDPRLRGVLVHRLLDQLAGLAGETREAYARRILEPYAGVIPEETRRELIGAATALLDDTAYAALFGPGSRGEVPIQGTLDGKMISGEIDRMLVTDDEVVVAEFKTTRWVPKAAGDVPRRHREQVDAYRRLIHGVYPGKAVRALLIYTAAPRAFVID